MKILVVEDDRKVASFLEKGLREALAGLPVFELYPGRTISLRLDPSDPERRIDSMYRV